MFYIFDRMIAKFTKISLILFLLIGGAGCLLFLLVAEWNTIDAVGVCLMFFVFVLFLLFLYGYSNKRGIAITENAMEVHRFLFPKRQVQPSEIGFLCIVEWGPFVSTKHPEDYKLGIVGSVFELERVEAFGPDIYVGRTQNADGALMAVVEYNAELAVELMSRCPCPVYLDDRFCSKFPAEIHRLMSGTNRKIEYKKSFCILRA